MKLPYELLLLALPYVTMSIPLERRSASFHSLRGLTSIEVDHSNQESSSKPNKFFHESTFSTHYDGRFAEEELPLEDRTYHLQLLLKSYVETMARIGVRTWIMHGCLLGWWWNQRIMPWDADVDFQIDERSMHELGNWWNMTVHHFKAEDLDVKVTSREEQHAKASEPTNDILQKGKKYLLEVNPYYTNMSTTDTYNKIDARWIDTSTGLYIDITTIHVAPIPSNPSDLPDDPEMYTKDQHAYYESQLFPLRSTTFESVPVKVPYAFEEILLEEYGPRALTDTWYRGYGFDAERKEWIVAEPTPQQSLRAGEREPKTRLPDGRGRKKPVPIVDENGEEGEDRRVYETKPGKLGDVHVVPGNSNG